MTIKAHANYMQPIYFDERWIGPHGIGRFAAEILQRLPGLIPLHVPVSKLSPLDPLVLSWCLLGKRNGIYFSPGFNAPLRCSLPMALTLHDLIHLELPHPPHIRAYYNLIVRPAVRKARWIFTVSETSRRAIANWAAIDPEKIHVVGNGLSAHFTLTGPRHTLERPYFLHVGSHATHKNITRLLDAFAVARKQADVLLLFTQTPSSATQRQIQRLALETNVRVTGKLDDTQLAAVYRGASALVYPSLQEGFGLPIIEAMACGTPVISSNIASIRETAGDGNAILCDPADSQAIADAMLSMIDARTAGKQLQDRGVLRASHFGWDKVAHQIAATLIPEAT